LIDLLIVFFISLVIGYRIYQKVIGAAEVGSERVSWPSRIFAFVRMEV
jgi:hypothetical protein